MFYRFECFNSQSNKVLIKTVCKLACKQVLVAVCTRSTASKALKGFIYVVFLFYGTLVLFTNHLTS